MSDFIALAKPIIGDDERRAVDKVLQSGMLAQGPEVAAFEEEFSTEFGLSRVCVAVNSGTSGLHLSLLAAGVGPGDEVVVPSFTFAATANAVALVGARPVFADIDADDFCIDPAAAEAAISDRTAAIMPVHLFGHPARMDKLTRIAQERNLSLIEDAAQAHGASLLGIPVGTFGSFGVFSLYPTKNMTAGEGGMVSVGDKQLERLLRLYRNQGMEIRYRHEVVGLNNRMSDLHAAIGRVQLRSVARWTKQRQRNAEFLSANLEGVGVPTIGPDAVHVFHQYTIRVAEDRDNFARALHDEFQVGSAVFYPVPAHRQAPFQSKAHLPVTDQVAKECLSIPVHPSLSDEDLERIVTAVNTLARAGS